MSIKVWEQQEFELLKSAGRADILALITVCKS